MFDEVDFVGCWRGSTVDADEFFFLSFGMTIFSVFFSVEFSQKQKKIKIQTERKRWMKKKDWARIGFGEEYEKKKKMHIALGFETTGKKKKLTTGKNNWNGVWYQNIWLVCQHLSEFPAKSPRKMFEEF